MCPGTELYQKIVPNYGRMIIRRAYKELADISLPDFGGALHDELSMP